jgi:hypothetical protein
VGLRRRDGSLALDQARVAAAQTAAGLRRRSAADDRRLDGHVRGALCPTPARAANAHLVTPRHTGETSAGRRSHLHCGEAALPPRYVVRVHGGPPPI